MLILATLGVAAMAQLTPVGPVRDASAWKPHPDGGRTVTVTAAGPTGVRLRYVDAAPHWGNVSGLCAVPRDATALRFTLHKHASAREAAMHIWLMEPDGDAWVQQVVVRGKPVGDLPNGSHAVRLAVGAFTFDPRGARTRQMPTAEKMLLGSNYGDLEVTVSDLAWETARQAATAPLPRTPGLKVPNGRRGRVAVLDMGTSLPDGFRTAHSPARMAAALQELGYGVAVLRAGDAADPAVLTPARFDAVVTTSGPYFPARAREVFTAFLKGGGSFLATDGYAFDRLVEWDGQAWRALDDTVNAEQTAAARAADMPMNVRRGTPGDALTFLPEQIGVFDPMYRVSGGASLRTGDGTVVARVGAGRAFEGYAAVGLLGDNSPVFPPVYRRWDPLLTVYDADGVALGPALSVMRNFAGAFRGSVWAFSGLTSGTDLFLGTPARRALLARTMAALTSRVFVHSLSTDLALYEPGETASVSLQVSNRGRRLFRGQLTLRVDGAPATGSPMTVPAGVTVRYELRVPIVGATPDLRRVTASLELPDGDTDTVRTAYCVRSPRVISAGPSVRWAGNYLTVDGRARFLCGTNQTGAMFYSAAEGPLVWDRDFAAMRRNGIHLLRILHFSPFAARGYAGDGAHKSLELANRPLRLQRQTDAIVQLAMKHRVAVMLTLHDWLGVGLTDDELSAQSDWNRFWASRYRNVPGMVYDVQNEPSVDVPNRPDMVALWNAWLLERYGTDDALRAAWQLSPPEQPLPNVPLTGGGGEWADVRTADRKRFEAEVLNRWVKANVDGIRAGDPNAPVTVGYLPSMPPADKMLGQRHTDFANMHYYGPLRNYALELKLTDRRFEGKGFSLGEFGAQEAHDARSAGLDDLHEAMSIRRFQYVVHYGAGLGAAFAANWSWKEMDEMVFPWGLLHRNTGLGKPWLTTYGQESLFLAFVEPAYTAPPVFLLAPDRHRIGPHFDELHGALQRSVQALLDARVDFGVINEEALDRLPAEARALLWPIPYTPTDEVLDRVARWVRAGGVLYVSGDVAFDAARQPTRTDRRTALGLDPRQVPTPPFASQPGGSAPAVVEATVGSGRVLHAPWPVEIGATAGASEVYARVLAAARIAGNAIEPAGAPVHVLSIPNSDGGRLLAVVRHDDGAEPLRVALPRQRLALTLGEGGCAFVVTDDRGDVVAAESGGPLVVDGVRLASANGHFGLVAMDGLPLVQSREVLVLPHHCRTVNVGGLKGVAGGQAHLTGLALTGGRRLTVGATLTFRRGEVGILAAPGRLPSAIEGVRRARDLAVDRP